VIFISSCKNGNDKKVAEKQVMDGMLTDTVSKVDVPRKPGVEVKKPKKIFIFSAIDSLKKYQDNDTLPIYMGRVNNIEYGLVPLTDSTYGFYQRQINLWKKICTLDIDFIQYVELKDLNGDGFNDIKVTTNVTGSGGNEENVVLLFDKTKKQFSHNDWWDLPNIKYDKKKKLIESSWWAGNPSSSSSKEIYRIQKDSLSLIEGVSYGPQDEKAAEDISGNRELLEYFTIRNGKRVTIKSIKGSAYKLQDVFEQTFWDSSDEY
jgi:hypothetical protein